MQGPIRRALLQGGSNSFLTTAVGWAFAWHAVRAEHKFRKPRNFAVSEGKARLPVVVYFWRMECCARSGVTGNKGPKVVRKRSDGCWCAQLGKRLFRTRCIERDLYLSRLFQLRALFPKGHLRDHQSTKSISVLIVEDRCD